MNGTPLVGSPIARVPPTAIKLGMCGFTIGREAYYRQFDVVEIQQTFYDPPAPETLVRWRSEAPAAFEFTMKAWQVVTHLGTSRTYRASGPPIPSASARKQVRFALSSGRRESA